MSTNTDLQTNGSQVNVPNDASEQDFIKTQMQIATKALNGLADEYMACVEILDETPPTHLNLTSEETAKLQMRRATIEKYFRSIGSNIRRYAEVD